MNCLRIDSNDLYCTIEQIYYEKNTFSSISYYHLQPQ